MSNIARKSARAKQMSLSSSPLSTLVAPILRVNAPAAVDWTNRPIDPFNGEADSRDARVQGLLASIIPGWTPSGLDAFIEGFFDFIALFSPSLSSTVARQYIGDLTKRLKENKYTPLKAAEYLSILQVAVKRLETSQDDVAKEDEPSSSMKQEVNRFVAIDGTTKGADPSPTRWGIWDREAGKEGDLLCNFTLLFERDVEILDDIESRRVFEGTVTLFGKDMPFQVSSEDYGNNDRLALLFSMPPAASRKYWAASTPCVSLSVRSARTRYFGGKKPPTSAGQRTTAASLCPVAVSPGMVTSP